jgi:hypothetical protein
VFIPAVGGVVPGEHPLGVIVAAVGPVMLETLPMPLVRVAGEGDPPGAVVARGAQFVVPIACVVEVATGAPLIVCAMACEIDPDASNSAHRDSAVAPYRIGNSLFITHIPLKPQPTTHT